MSAACFVSTLLTASLPEKTAGTESLTTVDICVVERYLVKVWAGARSNTTADTFDKFRHDGYLNGKALTDLPPTSTALCGNIGWCFCVIRNAITLLELTSTTFSIKTLVGALRAVL